MKRHLERAAVVGMLLLLAANDQAGEATKGAKDAKDTAVPNYYPLQAGNEWHLQLTANGKQVTVIQRVTKIENIDGMDLARVEALVDGKVTATEHLRQTAQGVFRYRFNGAECNPPFPVLKYPIKAGAQWEGEVKVGAETMKYHCKASEAEVEVPAGKFKTVRVDVQIDTGGKTLQLSNWLAPDVGIVRQTLEAGPLNLVSVLEKYEIKKPRRRP